MSPQSEPPVAALATAQLEAYNASDLDAFCACYAEDVRVLDADGKATVQGLPTFREGYRALFERFAEVHAEVSRRLVMGSHAVDLEQWSRRNIETGVIESGEILVRYTERDGLLVVVEFLR
jgi:hypothetical protein